VSRPFWLLVLIIGSGTLGMHILSPVLPLIGEDFSADIAATQLTVSLYMFVFAGGQLIYGPLSDRYGRKPVLLAGLAIYIVAGVLCATATTIEWLLAARMLQALGGCAGLVIGRAIVHDTSRDADAAATIGALNTVLLVSPAVAPVLGLWLAQHLDWRAVPMILVAFGVAAFIGTLWRISETGGRRSEPVRTTLANYARLAVSPRFMIQVLGGSLTTTTMFVVLTMSPFVVVNHLRRPLADAGFYYVVFIGGLIAGSIISTRLVRRVGFDRLILFAAACGTAGGMLHLGAYVTGRLDAVVFAIAGSLYTFMSGVMAPLALTRTVGLAPHLRGSANGIFGFSQAFAGAAAVTIAGAVSNVALSSGVVMLACAGTGLAILAGLHIHSRRAGKA
jgi:DHA1 family bicyclomycin/chloramphenicol resistance-like MFS transporter